MAGHLLRAMAPPAGVVVAGFWPLPGEIDFSFALMALHAAGHRVLLPATPRRGLPLVFRAWQPGMAMRAGRFGTREPVGEIGVPEIVYVPLLAFDRAGRRLGYGGGYYDRTLAGLPGAVAVGCGFAAQEVDAVPAGAYDARLQAVVTEAGVIRIEGI